MKEKIQKGLAAILMFVLVISCFAAVLQITIANPTPVPGNPGWDNKYQAAKTILPSLGPASDIPNNPRNNASGDKISSNAHSADFPGLYFYWDDKQKDNGVLLVNPEVFDYFEGGEFTLTAKNSNNYWGYKITPDKCQLIDGVYAFGISKQIKYNEIGNNGKVSAKTEDLKNINMVFIDGKYKDAKFEIVKVWLDEDGHEVTGDNKLVSFTEGWNLGTNTVKITDYTTAVNGKKVTVTEKAIPGFTTTQDKKSITVKYNDDPAQVVTVTNKKQFADITIVKQWLDFNGDKIEDTTGLEATFNIIGASATRSKIGVSDGTQQVKEGTYIVREVSATKGYTLVSENDIEITVAAGGKYTVTFTNQEDKPQEIGRTLTKLVDGVEFEMWAKGFTKEELGEILAGMTFELHKNLVDYELKQTPLATGKVTGNGIIDFDFSSGLLRDAGPGKFYVVERLTGKAAEVFDKAAEPLEVYVEFRADGSAVIDVFDYDPETLYTIVNGYNWPGRRTLGYPGLNNDGDLFYIGVTNTKTGTEYASYCAHAGSKNFAGDAGHGCAGYMVAISYRNPAVPIEGEHSYADFLSALNYIEDKYGNLNENRAITQTVIWALLGAVDVESSAFAATNLSSEEKAVVIDVMENYEGYTGRGKIVDIVYMICEEHGTDEFGLLNCQPQLVPIYYEQTVFNNKLKEEFPVSFMKTKFGGLLNVEAGEFGFELFKIVDDAETKIGTYYTKTGGEVTVDTLAPGKYVFRETLSTYAIDGIAEYKLRWKAIYPNGADGLYFELKADGTVIWAGDAVVNNELVDKRYVQWIVGSPDSYTGMGEIGEVFEDGFIFYPLGKKAAIDTPLAKWTYVEPTCTQGGYLSFTYGVDEQLMGIGSDNADKQALGHAYELNAMGDGLRCSRCVWDYGWWDLSEELLAIYHELGGQGGL
ncbi:MAG: hypothetical protein LBH79_03865 [Nitrososphaerota archaeon]|jgi:hypothetical protein|nr:hypothetical protein [Nitrososphaerota archaeon]